MFQLLYQKLIISHNKDDSTQKSPAKISNSISLYFALKKSQEAICSNNIEYIAYQVIQNLDLNAMTFL